MISATTAGALAEMARLGRTSEQTGQRIERGLGGSLKPLIADIAHIGGAAAVLQGLIPSGLIADLARAADGVKQLDARLLLATRSRAEMQAVRQEILAIAQASGAAAGDVGQLFARIAQPIRDLGGTSADAVQVTDLVGKALRITGASAQESSSAILQFSQAMGSGVLRGEELNAIMESAPRLAQALADGLGVPIGELRKLGEQGQLTSQQVLRALQSQAGALTSEAASLPATLSIAWNNLGQSVQQTIGEFDRATGTTAALAGGINALAENLPAVAAGIAKLGGAALAVAAVRAGQAIQAQVAATRAKIVADREAAAMELQRVQSAVAVANAVRTQATADIAAAEAALFYATSTNAAALAAQKRAAQERLLAANTQLRALTPVLAGAQQAARATQSVTLLGTALGAARAAGGRLLAMLGGPWGIAFLTAITFLDDIIEWLDQFRDKSEDIAAGLGDDLREATDDFKRTAGSLGDAEQLAKIDALKAKIAEVGTALQNPAVASSEVGQKLSEAMAKATDALDKFDQKAREVAANRTKERGLLGLDKLRQEVDGLIDADFQAKLNAFTTLWRDAMAGARGDNDKLIASTLELRQALTGLLAEAKTPAEFGAVIDRAGSALLRSPDSAFLRSTLESAIEQRRRAEAQQLDALVNGLTARMQRQAELVDNVIDQAAARFSSAAALARAAAELRDDPAAISQIDATQAQAATRAEAAQAALRLRNAEAVSTRRVQLIEEERQAVVSGARDEQQATEATTAAKLLALESQQRVQERLAAIQREQALEAQAAGQFGEARRLQAAADAAIAAARKAEDERAKAAEEAAQRIEKARGAEVAAAKTANDKIVAEDRRAAAERLDILKGLYTQIQQRQDQALQQYKNYANQVISLDQKIRSNRLEKAGALAEIDRQDATPAEQAASIREQLASLKAEAKKALGEGQQEAAREILGQAKQLARQLANLKMPEQTGGIQTFRGDAPNNKEEGKNALAEIIDQEGEILKQQRAEAQAAADKQLQTYKDMTAALTELGTQIQALNEQSAISLKPELDGEAMNTTIAAIQAALANTQFTIKVTPDLSGLPSGDGTTPTVPAKAAGGEITGPGPKGRDSVLMFGAPGEHMLTAAEVDAAGGHAAIYRLRALLRSGRLRELIPGFAAGGAILPNLRQPSLLERLRLPSMPSLPAPGRAGDGLQPMNLTIPGMGTFPVRAKPDVAKEMHRVLALESLKRGSH